MLSTRPSQHKFDSDFKAIDVCLGGESVFKPGHLNRQLILLLSARGIGEHCFRSLQHEMSKPLKLLLDAAQGSDHADTSALVEAAERFHPRAIVLDMLRGGVEPSSEELLSRMLRQLAKAHLERLRDGGRIRVQDACLLKGVPDRDGGDLQHGECFLWPQVPEDANRFAKPITGKVIIAKNPALHPGDVRVLRAVDRRSEEAKRRGEGLRNVLVFPVDTRGKRSHAHETSGGDLDGDEFFICWDSRLTACNECEPSNAYTDQDRLRQAPTADSDETLDDEAKRIQYFLEFQEKNVLEVIATHWLIFACQEKEGAWSPKCLELARKHSMAVDAPKLGTFPALEAKDAPASVPKFLKEFSKKGNVDHDSDGHPQQVVRKR